MFQQLQRLAWLALLVEANKHAIGPSPNQAYLRVEGLDNTLFEGIVYHPYPRDIETPSSDGPHKCDGTNHGENLEPGPTCTTILAQAAKRHGFTFDGTWSTKYKDFAITSIAGETVNPPADMYWGLLYNGQFPKVGGCQQEITPYSQTLWAFDAFNKNYTLEMSGPTVGNYPNTPNRINTGDSITVNVINTLTGQPFAGATVSEISGPSGVPSQTTDSSGNAVFTFNTPGRYRLKADDPSAIRSNRVVVVVHSS